MPGTSLTVQLQWNSRNVAARFSTGIEVVILGPVFKVRLESFNGVSAINRVGTLTKFGETIDLKDRESGVFFMLLALRTLVLVSTTYVLSFNKIPRD